MKSVAAAFVVINSYKASGDMLGGRERGSGNESAQVGVGFGCGSIQFEGKWDDLRSQDSKRFKSFEPLYPPSSKSSNSSNLNPFQIVKLIKFIEFV